MQSFCNCIANHASIMYVNPNCFSIPSAARICRPCKRCVDPYEGAWGWAGYPPPTFYCCANLNTPNHEILLFFCTFEKPALRPFSCLSSSTQVQLVIKQQDLVTCILYLLFDTKFAQRQVWVVGVPLKTVLVPNSARSDLYFPLQRRQGGLIRSLSRRLFGG